MTRTSLFLLGLGAALAFPTVASAHCGSNQGSFSVTCERGVTVYRHNALSSIPQGISQADAQLEVEKIRAKTARARIESEERISIRRADTRERKAVESRSRFRTDRNGRRIFGGIQAFGFNDIGFGGPISGVTPVSYTHLTLPTTPYV